MHNRARYKENLRELVVSWNAHAADQDKIDLSGFADAVTLPGQPLRLRNRRAPTACDQSPSDDEAVEAGVAAAAAEALADVSRSSGSAVCVHCEDTTKTISNPVHSCARCEGIMHGTCGTGIPGDDMKRVCGKCGTQGL